MPREQLRIGSLFTGYGGLDLAVEQFFDARTVWTCDNDPGACKIIAHRYPGIPNLGDITKVDWAGVEPVDILTGGWPCQPFSHAGKRLGAADERALWPEVARAVRTLRPRYVVLENVAAIASAGELARAAGDLAALGYVGSWRSLRAADVGAPHGRSRTFILAANAERGGWDGWLGQLRPGRWPQLANSGEPIADTERERLEGSEPQRLRCSISPATDAECFQPTGRGGVRDVGGAAEDRSQEAQQWQRDRNAAHHRGTTAADADEPGPQGTEPAQRPDVPHRGITADATSNGWHERRPEPARLVGGSDAAERGATTADAESYERRLCDRDGLSSTDAERGGCDWRPSEPIWRQVERTAATRRSAVDWGVYALAVERWERLLDRPAPSPTVLSEKYLARRARRLAKRDKRPVGMRGSLAPARHLSPRFVEWMQGLPAGWVTDVPGLIRNAQLKALGNGVVPQQAYAALQLLADDVPQSRGVPATRAFTLA